jgi:hypothetical protein
VRSQGPFRWSFISTETLAPSLLGCEIEVSGAARCLVCPIGPLPSVLPSWCTTTTHRTGSLPGRAAGATAALDPLRTR